jgi:hypothetical protein
MLAVELHLINAGQDCATSNPPELTLQLLGPNTAGPGFINVHTALRQLTTENWVVMNAAVVGRLQQLLVTTSHPTDNAHNTKPATPTTAVRNSMQAISHATTATNTWLFLLRSGPDRLDQHMAMLATLERDSALETVLPIIQIIHNTIAAITARLCRAMMAGSE